MPEQYRYLKLVGGAYDDCYLRFPVEETLEPHFYMPNPDGSRAVYEFCRVVHRLLERPGQPQRRVYMSEYNFVRSLRVGLTL